jgi:hypothetical protein
MDGRQEIKGRTKERKRKKEKCTKKRVKESERNEGLEKKSSKVTLQPI